MVTVKVTGPLGVVVGRRELTVELAGATLGDVVRELAARYGAKVTEQLLDEEGNLDFFYLAFVAGKRVHSLSAAVKDGDEVLFIPAMAGG